MAQLAEELCGCKAELLTGGLNGSNAATMVAHLWKGQPVLIPYPPPKKRVKVDFIVPAHTCLPVGDVLDSVDQL